jgi:tetratricopeptide (TPR) repeat protein
VRSPTRARQRRRHRTRRAAALLGAALLLACAGPAPSPDAGPTRSLGPRDPELAATLVDLGGRALAAGELDVAEDRFERALQADATSLAARVGLGRSALARGAREEAAQHFEEALAVDGESVEARLGLARLAAQAGRTAAARTHLERALASDPRRVEAHARLEALTGRAPRPLPDDADALVAAAERHPYDAELLARAGRALAATGEPEPAQRLFERALLLLDEAPPTTLAVVASGLAQVAPEWRDRLFVPVHVYADETLAAREGWRFRMRLLWLDLSTTFGPLLPVRYVVASIGRFRAGDADELDEVRAAFDAQHAHPPEHGIVAVLTGRPQPRRRGTFRRGEAEFLGRDLTVRLDAAATPDLVGLRTLAHEVAHLYGGVHVSPRTESLLNPSGDSRRLDPWNAAVMRALADRRFGPGGPEQNVLPFVDLDETIAAYGAVLQANLDMRRLGIAQAMEARQESRFLAARQAREAGKLDPHLGDVSRFLAVLLLRDGQPEPAAFLLRNAARLYGPQSARGRAALAQARAVEAGRLR